MTGADLVNKLLAAIQEREDIAREAEELGLGGEWFSIVDAGSGDAGVESHRAHVVKAPNWIEFNRHIALNDPRSVLLLCQAHREIIDEWRRVKYVRDELLVQMDTLGDLGRAETDRLTMHECVLNGLHFAVRTLARGYGLEAS